MVSSICPYLGKSNLTYIFPNGLKLATRWPFVSQLELRSSNVLFFLCQSMSGSKRLPEYESTMSWSKIWRDLQEAPKLPDLAKRWLFFWRSYPRMIQEIYRNVGNCPTAQPSGKRSNSSRLFICYVSFWRFSGCFPLPCFKFLVGENL